MNRREFVCAVPALPAATLALGGLGQWVLYKWVCDGVERPGRHVGRFDANMDFIVYGPIIDGCAIRVIKLL